MNRNLDGILGLASKGLDAEMLLDPLEEEFRLPTVAVKQGDVLGRKVEVVCIVDERPSEDWCTIGNTPKVGRMIPFVPFGSEADSLVEQYIVLSVDGLISSDDIGINMSFLTDDKESPKHMYGEGCCKVELAEVEDITGMPRM